MFHMSNDSELFRTEGQLAGEGLRRAGAEWISVDGERWVPLYEQSMVHQYDIDWLNHKNETDISEDKFNYWVPDQEALARTRMAEWPYQWIIGWRRTARTGDERTLLACVLPLAGVGDSIFLMLPRISPDLASVLIGILNSTVLDFIARQKLGGGNFSYYYLEQLPILPPGWIIDIDIAFAKSRVLQLTYVTENLRPFALDLGYDGPPFHWDPDRRALLKAELDAYFAYLYGLSRDELRYILDPKEVMGADYPSETFRVLKENEIKADGEYRTRRFVLEAWDRFAEDGTFDPARLQDPTHFDVVRRASVETRGQVTSLERERGELLALLKRSDATPLPPLFVEGESDVAIVTAAWQAFHPTEPLPVTILAAGGTRQMGSLAGKGAALRQVLGDRLVFALADNDREGRDLVEDGRTRRGGVWRQQTNGIHWCLLAPTDEFVRAMKRFDIPEAFWPFTIENAFPTSFRRQAMAEGAYAVEEAVIQSSFQADAGIANKALRAAHQLDRAGDDAVLYFRPPAPGTKLAFAEWIATPEQRCRANFGAFTAILDGLSSVISSTPRSDSRAAKDGTRAL
jgi:hypothetical protein